jgi:hypothetical protein
VHVPSGQYIAVWDAALRGYGPNLGYDYGGRLVGAWVEGEGRTRSRARQASYVAGG